MKLLIIPLIAAFGLLVVLTGTQRIHSVSTIGRGGAGSGSALQDMLVARSD